MAIRRFRTRVILLLELVFLGMSAFIVFRSTRESAIRRGKVPVDYFSPVSKTLVIATTTEGNTTWLDDVRSDWTILSYVSDDPTAELTVPANRGNEAMVYLTYIVDNYEDLPDITYFHHDHLIAWHQILDSVTEVNNLQTNLVKDEGYVSTRCVPGCENYIPLSKTVVSLNVIGTAGRELQIPTFLRHFIGEDYPMPEVIAAPCCGQFAASKDAILRRSKEFWQKLQAWLADTPLDSSTSGRLIEYTWHILFGMESKQ